MAFSSIASLDFRMDDWGVDLAVTGQPEGPDVPRGASGMSPVSARKAMAASKHHRHDAPAPISNFSDMVKDETRAAISPYTPPTQLFHGLKASLDRILRQEGLGRRHRRAHHHLAEGRCAAAWAAMGAGPRRRASQPRPSDTVSAIPGARLASIAREVIRIAYEDLNTSFGFGPRGRSTAACFRIGHIGDLNEAMVLTAALSVAELALVRAVRPRSASGAGVGAAQAWFATKRRAFSRRRLTHCCRIIPPVPES